jgi:hypothetical protein
MCEGEGGKGFAKLFPERDRASCGVTGYRVVFKEGVMEFWRGFGVCVFQGHLRTVESARAALGP